MSLLDDLCRLCAHKLDRSLSRNIFAPEQRNLLSIILRCIPTSVEKDDRYPKYVCIHCVFKLDVLFEMSDQSLSSVKVFNEILASEEKENPETVVKQVKQEASYDVEFYEQTEHKFDVTEYEISRANDYNCEHCSGLFNSKEQLIKHALTHLTPSRENCNADERKTLEINRYVCDTCGSAFSRKSVFYRHTRKHIGEPASKNHPSQESIPDAENDNHTKKTHYHCKMCNKYFSRKFHLNRHKLSHKGNKPYQCQVCGKTFGTQSCLVRHKSIHEGNKPYQCEECEKGFSDRSNFLRHQNIHTGKRTYQCKFCDKNFTDQSTLISHHRTHTGERPFKCEHCGKSYSKISTRNKHKLTHTGKKPYQCEVCFKNFTVKYSLEKHRKAFHSLV